MTDTPTCPLCGCLIGNQDTHREWHASGPAEAPPVKDSAPDPDAQKGPDPAPYSA